MIHDEEQDLYERYEFAGDYDQCSEVKKELSVQ